MSMIDTLYERERLKMQILADEPKIPAFIVNSYQLWGAAQFGSMSPEKIFYGTGTLRDVLGRLLARKSCMSAWREAKKDDQTLRLIGPMATVLEYSREIAKKLQEHLKTDTPYDALVEFQTPGFVDPFEESDFKTLHKKVKDIQVEQAEPLPHVPDYLMKTIIRGLVDVAGVDQFKVNIVDNVAHPACLGYGGVPKGVVLGLTHDYEDPILGILTNWHEIGHAIYRQSIPYGRMVQGRAMDESIAFMYEHVIGRSDEFLTILLDAGLTECGYTLEMLRNHVRVADRETKRIETNPLRHAIDIRITDQLERALINDEVEAEDVEIFWQNLIKPYRDILPDAYPFYWDVHQMTGIYGDRACYNPGLLGGFQLGDSAGVTLGNVGEFIQDTVNTCDETRFDKTIEHVSGKPLSTDAFFKWSNSFYS
ncbi:MAG: hypothetical protein COB76_01335 [Alphaproteobacteria bacterium]|nr:MAG: hypothetical protein COB76_01335 [Alphaproteobacteria bacterium]